MIPTPSVRVDVVLEIISGNNVVCPVQAPLGVAPERFDGIGMGRAVHVDLSRMMDPAMGIALTGQGVVAGQFVAEDSGFRENVGLDEWDQGCGLNIWNHFSDYLAFSFDSPGNNSFTARAPATLAAPLESVPVTVFAANVGFVHFNAATQEVDIFGHQLTDHGEHAPGGLVGDSKLSLKVFSGNASSGISHDEYGVEPILHRGAGLVHDGIGRGGKLVSAVVALVSLAATNQMELVRAVTLGALDILRPTLVAKPVQAGFIIGKHLVELLESERFHRVRSVSKLAIL